MIRARVAVALLVVAMAEAAAGEMPSASSGSPTEERAFPAAPKVSFEEAGLEPLSASELIEKYRAALDSVQSCALQSENHRVTLTNPAMAFGGEQLPARIEYWSREDFRYDGKRYSVREERWGGVWNVPEERPQYHRQIYDGEELYSIHGREGVGTSLGIGTSESYAKRGGGAPVEIMVNAHSGSALQGFPREEHQRLDTTLAGARSISVRSSMERVGDSECYVIDAVTEFGKYTVWIDPAHGYHAAQFTNERGPGDVAHNLRPMRPEWRCSSYLRNVRFEQVDGLWVPVEGETKSTMDLADRRPPYHEEDTKYHKVTEVVLNPDHDALGSFLRDDIKEGADVRNYYRLPGIRCVWIEGKAVPQIEAEVAQERARLGREKIESRLNVGDPAPAFTVDGLDRRPLSMLDLRGRYVLLHFWASYCGQSREDMLHLKTVYDAFGADERFAMVGLSLDLDTKTAGNCVREEGLKWRQGYLGPWSETKLPDEYGVYWTPAVFLIGPDGKVIARNLRGRGIVEAVAKALGKEVPPLPDPDSKPQPKPDARSAPQPGLQPSEPAAKPAEPGPAGPPGPATSARPGEDTVILVSGSVLYGKVTTTRTHVIVTSENGVLEIPRERVRQVIRADTGAEGQR